MQKELTQERLKELLDYDPDTGIFRWRVDIRCGNGAIRRPAWSIAGGLDGYGHIQIPIDGRKYKAHRLAWLSMTGNFPPDEIDHRNNNPSDNRWDNLRLATHNENMMNKKIYKNNTSGFKGVCYHKQRHKYYARIMCQGKQISLGLFDTPELAYQAYCQASKLYHGDFGRVE